MGDLGISSKDTESGSGNDFFEKMEMNTMKSNTYNQ